MRYRYAPNQKRQGGFTLLEVILALTIGILLMSALYVAVDVQLRHAQAGRDIVQQSTLVRSIMTRVAADISKSVGLSTPVLQAQSSMSGQAGGTGSTGSSGSGGSSGSSGSTSGTNVSSTSGSSSSSGTTTTTSANASVINLGIQGDSAHLIISGSIVPREFVLGGPAANNNTVSLPLSDLRWICYWVVGSGDSAGLARQELTTVTGQDPTTIIPSDSDAAGLIIAEEVKSVQFSYFDGTNWQDSWTGTTPGPDGSTPMGAPVAIAVVIGMAQPGSSDIKSYRRVVAIPTSNQTPSNSSMTSTSTGG
jgi:prepilin-type N-terminal cleavage/methylation domain-containing protein